MSDYRTQPIPDKATIGDLYKPCAKVTDKAEAAAYFDKLIEWHMRVTGQDQNESASIIAQNIGYYSGYYDRATSLRIRYLFSCDHPIFGQSYPSAQEAFEAGTKAADNFSWNNPSGESR